MNRAQFTGRLVADLERGETKGGTVVAKGRLAVDRAGQNNEAGFIAFESYGAGADAALRTIGKGWLVAFDGRLQHDQWEQDGQKRQAYKFVGDIEFLAPPQNKGDGRAVEQQAETEKAAETEAEAEAEQESDHPVWDKIAEDAARRREEAEALEPAEANYDALDAAHDELATAGRD